MRKKPFLPLLTGLLLSTSLNPVYALQLDGLTPEEAGLKIAAESDRRDTGFGNSTANMTMVLRNRKGEESVRQIRNKTLEVPGDGDKSMSIFDEPADVKGTVSLTYSHGLKPDDQWLYLPALKRVKRINSKNKSGPFMGSEFAFEDIGSQEIGKYAYKYISDEVYNGLDCYIVERYPQYKFSGYTRQVTWIDKAEFRAQKIDFYDRKNALLKTLKFNNYKKYLDQYWRAHTMNMVNHQTGKSTTLRWDNFQFRTDLTERDFDQSALKRIR